MVDGLSTQQLYLTKLEAGEANTGFDRASSISVGISADQYAKLVSFHTSWPRWLLTDVQINLMSINRYKLETKHNIIPICISWEFFRVLDDPEDNCIAELVDVPSKEMTTNYICS